VDVYSEARARGLVPEFIDARGEHRRAAPGALRAVLDALPPQISRRHLTSVLVLRAGRDRFAFDVEGAPEGWQWRLLAGEQKISEGVVAHARIPLPDRLPIGCYRLELLDHAERESALVLVVPARACAGSFDRVWLLNMQLYSIASARNWGIGDFSDLASLIETSASKGCGGIGLNPLHVLFDDRPDECSPYAPNSRLFLNPLYIDVEAVPEFEAIADLIDREAIQAEKSRSLIDYRRVADFKLEALRRTFDRFRTSGSTECREAFARFRRERRPVLQHFACFEILRHRMGEPWWRWPAEWQRPDDTRLTELHGGPDAIEIEFIEYQQWCAHEQLQRCTDLAKSRGMPVGLYLDIAVGVQAGGFDAWSEQQAIARTLSVGAPPDSLNTAGQDWGVSGFTGDGLVMRDFAPFRDMLRAAMRYGGAVRLDHILGLNRLYLVPSGYSPRDGTYVEMPLQALLAVTAQESAAHRCVVIGEDLGTVPDGFRDVMADWGIFGYRVMLFERGDDCSFRPAPAYARDALVTFNTHDLASFAGWRSAHDLKVKRTLGIDPGESDEARARANIALDEILGAHDISRRDFLGVVEFMDATPSRILAIALDDLLGLYEQPNVPGTVDGHPNWRRRLPLRIEELPARLATDFERAVHSRRCAASAAPPDRVRR
jgi:4-alpha-glucanotransferase